MNDTGNKNPIKFDVGADFTFLGLKFTAIVRGQLDRSAMLCAFTRDVPILSILRPQGIEIDDLPEALRGIDPVELDIKELFLYLDTKGKAVLRGDVELKQKKLGADLKDLGTANVLILKFKFVIIDKKLSSLQIGLHAEMGEPLLPGITCERFDLIFAYNANRGGWKLAGRIKAQIFDLLKDVDLFASYEDDPAGKRFQLATNFSRDRGAIQENEFVDISEDESPDGSKVTEAVSREIWQDLKDREYLYFDEKDKAYKLSSKFKSYDENFKLDLSNAFRNYEKSIRKKLQETKPLIEFPGIASIDVKGIRLSIEKASSNRTKWSFSSVGDFKVYEYDPVNQGNVLINIDNGKLALLVETGRDTAKGRAKIKLSFTAKEARFKSPRLVRFTQVIDDKPVEKEPGFDIDFKEITIEKEVDWSFKSEVQFFIMGMPSPLDQIFPEDPKTADFTIKKKNGKWKVHAGLTGTLFELDIPDIAETINKQIQENGPKLLPEIGKGKAGLYGVALNIDDGLSLDLTIGIGLPSKLNELIGLKPHQIIRTYNPKDKDSIIKARLSIGTTGISGVVLDSPLRIKGLEDITRPDGTVWLEVDLDDFFETGKQDLGLIRFQKPELKIDLENGSFKATGGYEIDKKRHVKIPLFFMRKALEMLDLKDMADVLPSGIPVKSIEFFDKKNKKLMVNELREAMKKMGIRLPQEIWAIIDEIAKMVNHLPDRFKDYLGIKIPEGLTFAIDITGDGSVSFDLKVNKDGPPLQLLLPNLPNPMFTGIRLYRLAFGTALASQVLKLELDGEIDTFDLVSLAGAVIMGEIPDKAPEELKVLLPEPARFQKTFIVRDLVTLIIYQTQIPIPIPLFYEKLEVISYGIDDFKLHTAISFPKPEFDLPDLLNRFNDLLKFFTVPYEKGVFENGTEKGLLPLENYGEKLDRDPHKKRRKLNISFSAGPFYVRLPKYLDTQDTTYWELTPKVYDDLATIVSESNYKNILALIRLRAFTPENFEFEVDNVIDENADDRKTIVNACEHKNVPLGQVIGTPRRIELFNGWNLLYLILNSGKKLSLNYSIQYVNIDDRIGQFKLHFFKIFEIHVSWLLTTPYEFSCKRFVSIEDFSPLGADARAAWEALSDKEYIEKSGGITATFNELTDPSGLDLPEAIAGKRTQIYETLQNAPTVYNKFLERCVATPAPASPAGELLMLLADNDTGQELTEDDEGLAVFLRGGLDIAGGAIALESAIGLSANAVTGFRTGVSFSGYAANFVDVKLLGFIKISPKSKDEPFKLLGKSSLAVFNRQIMAGLFDITVGKDSHFHVEGHLDLFPATWPVTVKGHVIGHIDKHTFFYDAGGWLALGILHAGAQFHIEESDPQSTFTDRNKKYSEYSARIEFLNSVLRAGLRAESDETRTTLALDLYIKALNIIEYNADLVAVADLASGVTLNGTSTLDIRIPTPFGRSLEVTHIETRLSGAFDPFRGFLGLEASLSRDSYLLTPACRVSGGVAFFLWFAGEHAGDFILSLGGYHPDFKRPSHYPVVPTVAIDWRLAGNMHVRGSVYFALTPACIMFGIGFEFQWHLGGLKAWFTAMTDFILSWQPFYFHAHINVGMGVSYTFSVLGIRKTLGFRIRAMVELWGPDGKDSVAGRAKVDLGIVSFSISFGSGKPADSGRVGNWQEFRKRFLPDHLGELTAAEGLVKIAPDKSKTAGTSKKEIWVFNPHEFCLKTRSVVPVTAIAEGDGAAAPVKTNPVTVGKPGVAALNVKADDFTSVNTISISEVVLKNGQESLTPREDHFTFKPILGNAPRALWGETAGPDPSSTLVRNTVQGFEIRPKNPGQHAAAASAYTIEALQRTRPAADAFTWHAAAVIQKKDKKGWQDIEQTLAATKEKRQALLAELGYDAQDFGVKQLTQSSADAFLYTPEVWNWE